ncbi:MAG TPA: polysaccharide deacetylase family protein [Chloroflexota bacterium]|jgi:peptidoglycan/xylan/chitin deacetylase (PgdA/CDA1 family)
MSDRPYVHSALPERPPLRWPGGAWLAVWVVPNIDYYPLDGGGPALRPASIGQVPDPYNVGWRDYGPRVGIWRLMEVFDRHGLRATAALNADACEQYPEIVAAGVQRRWEFMGHARTSAQGLHGLEPDAERELIADTLARITRTTGQRPRGWLSPSLAETPHTLDLLAAAGIDYVCDWCADDQPFALQVARGQLHALPYTVELNDIPAVLRFGHTAPQFAEAIRAQFDVLYAEGARSGRVLCVSVHPCISGQPLRAKYLAEALAYIAGHPRVWLATGSEILAAYLAQADEGHDWAAT